MSAAMRATADTHAKLTYSNTITVYCYLLLPSAKTVEVTVAKVVAKEEAVVMAMTAPASVATAMINDNSDVRNVIG